MLLQDIVDLGVTYVVLRGRDAQGVVSREWKNLIGFEMRLSPHSRRG